jgi:hypothetical protein
MSDVVPLLKKSFGSDLSRDEFEDTNNLLFNKDDVLLALKNFQEAKLIANTKNHKCYCSKCKESKFIYYNFDNKLFCKDCWFKECFGEIK